MSVAPLAVGLELNPSGCRAALLAAGESQPALLHPEFLPLEESLASLPSGAPVALAFCASMTEAQRRNTRAAVAQAGLNPLRLYSAPLAGAVAAGLPALPNGTVAVLDVGEYSFDFRIICVGPGGELQIEASSVDQALGGWAMDRAFAQQLLRELQLPSDAVHIEVAHGAAAQARAALSQHFSVPLCLQFPDGRVVQRRLDRHRFAHTLRPLLEQITTRIHQALEEASLRADELDEVLLLGPGGQAPWMRAFAGELFSRHPRQSPLGAPALGAALLARRLVNAEPPLIFDAVSATLGLEADDGYIEWLLPRNTPLPASAVRMREAGSLLLKVYQGERLKLSDCQLIATCAIETHSDVQLRFILNADSLLQVEAQTLAGEPCPVELRFI